MSYKASDGREFGNPAQARLYEKSLADRGADDVANAPGGEQYEADVKAHGTVHEAHIKAEGNGRWRLTTTHADGAKSTSVHPQWFRAHELAGKYFDPDGKPAALETHQRARAHPAGPKEEERIAREDGREVDDEG